MITYDSAPASEFNPSTEAANPVIESDPSKVRDRLTLAQKEVKKAKRWMSEVLPSVEGILIAFELLLEQKGHILGTGTQLNSQRLVLPANFDWDTLQIE